MHLFDLCLGLLWVDLVVCPPHRVVIVVVFIVVVVLVLLHEDVAAPKRAIRRCGVEVVEVVGSHVGPGILGVQKELVC
jgi:hypothetical protein